MAEPVFVTFENLEELDAHLLDINLEADANALLPPPPKGIYLVTAEFSSADPEKRWIQKEGKSKTFRDGFLMCGVTFTIVEHPSYPKEYAGRKFFDYVFTMVGPNKTTKVMGLLQATSTYDLLKSQQNAKTHKAQKIALEDALASTPQLGVYIDWEASIFDKTKNETVFGPVRGMGSFPRDAEGNYLPYAIDPKFGEVPARAVVKRYCNASKVGDVATGEAVEEVQQEEGEYPVEDTQAEPAPQATQAPKAAPILAPAAQAPQAPRPAVTAPAVGGGVRRPPVKGPTAVGR